MKLPTPLSTIFMKALGKIEYCNLLVCNEQIFNNDMVDIYAANVVCFWFYNFRQSSMALLYFYDSGVARGGGQGGRLPPTNLFQLLVGNLSENLSES